MDYIVLRPIKQPLPETPEQTPSLSDICVTSWVLLCALHNIRNLRLNVPFEG